MSRILQIAKQCQLLTGSYDGATRSCDCSNPQKCHLTEQQRLEHEQLPDVITARSRNLQEFNLHTENDSVI